MNIVDKKYIVMSKDMEIASFIISIIAILVTITIFIINLIAKSRENFLSYYASYCQNDSFFRIINEIEINKFNKEAINDANKSIDLDKWLLYLNMLLITTEALYMRKYRKVIEAELNILLKNTFIITEYIPQNKNSFPAIIKYINKINEKKK